MKNYLYYMNMDGWDKKLGQYHSIRASKDFAEIWNSGVYNI